MSASCGNVPLFESRGISLLAKMAVLFLYTDLAYFESGIAIPVCFYTYKNLKVYSKASAICTKNSLRIDTHSAGIP